MLDFLELEARIAADDRFPRVALRLCETILDFFGGHPAARRLLADQGQMRVATACVVLDPEIRLPDVVALVPAPIASPNRVAAALHLMRREGALVPTDQGLPRGRSVGPLGLSPAFAGLARGWLRAMVEPAIVFADEPVADFGCPLLYRRMCRAYLEATLLPTRSLKVSGSVERAQSRRGGALLLLEVMRRTLGEGNPPAFSKRAFAQRFGLSRTQVVGLVQEAALAGLLADSGGSLAASAAGRADGRRWLAKMLALGTASLDGSLAGRLAASRARLAAERDQISTVARIA